MKDLDKFLKIKDMKTYSSTEWFMGNKKKYRTVFDENEVSYIYCELSFFNKQFDIKEWPINLLLKCFNEKGTEICSLDCSRTIDRSENLVYIREGWGVKTIATYWKAGRYTWKAIMDDEILLEKDFFIEKQGLLSKGFNPYFKLNTVKLYESTDANVKLGERKYYTVFNALSSRYVWIEIEAKNLVRKSEEWVCEITFNYRNEIGMLKGTITKILMISNNEETIKTSVGWGSDMVGTWGRGQYTIEMVFMDKIIAKVPFEIGDDYVEAQAEDFIPSVISHSIVPLEITEEEKKQLKPKTAKDVMKELDQLIGLDSIKKKIYEYSDYLKFIALRKEKGFDETEKINLNAVFKGNPGTGKTTVARMLGKIYKDMGLLKKGHVHEVDRADLVAEFIGQTAPKTKEAIKKAKDGILFIDEAYALARQGDDNKDFGREAIEILIKEMTSNNNMAVIVAGYPAEMDNFIESNPGLKSRFNMYYDFPDYVPQELMEIAEFTSNNKKIHLAKPAKDSLYKYLVDSYRSRTKFFGNARMVNSIIDEAKMNLGLRIMKSKNPEKLTQKVLSEIKAEDINKVFAAEQNKIADIPIDEALLKASVKKLHLLIGLQGVKDEIDELIKLVRFYKESGKNVRQNFSLHSVFSGNPGTGKTTVARILAQIFKALGIIERGHLVECDRQNMVGAYIGQTAIKTSELIEKAMGGVLFVDEAYSLTEGSGQDYGREAVETLLKIMEDRRGEFIVIAAGYTQNMNRFLESNPGLKSRFDRVFDFEDFNVDELVKIAFIQFKDNNIKPDAKAAAHLKKYIKFVAKTKDKYFGNGRAIRKIVEEAVRSQHLRLSQIPKEKRTEKVVQTLTLEDVEDFRADNTPNKPTSGMGF